MSPCAYVDGRMSRIQLAPRTPSPQSEIDHGDGVRVCPQREHADVGKASPVVNWLQSHVGLPDAYPRCTNVDPLGGGIEYDGKCECRDQFHVVESLLQRGWTLACPAG